MSPRLRRIASGFIAAAVISSMAIEPSYSQVTPGSPTVGPAGGVASTTAPGNSQGTPAGGTGVLSTTRVGPSTVAPAVAPNTTPMASPSATAAPRPPRRRRRAMRRRPRPAAEVGTQSQAGTNGAMPAATK